MNNNYTHVVQSSIDGEYVISGTLKQCNDFVKESIYDDLVVNKANKIRFKRVNKSLRELIT